MNTNTGRNTDMAKETDRRVRKTREQLRRGLAELLCEKSIREITVKELVERVDINRSTFYLHYSDIYDMMEKIENGLVEDIEKLIEAHPVSPFNEKSFPFIEDIFVILSENRAICAALLGPHGDISFLHRIEGIISEHCLNVLKVTFPDQLKDLKYSYSFCLSGCIGLTKTWLNGQYEETPRHMAEITFRLIMNALHGLEPGR